MEYERVIYDAMEQVKSIETSSTHIKNVYKTNAKLMKDINSDQDEILKQLSSVEDELDMLLSTGIDGYSYHKAEALLEFYRDPISTSN